MKYVETPIQIRFVDIDQLGHVNNALYLTYLEIARIPYFDQLVGKIDWLTQGFILAKVEIDYKIPIYLKDSIKVKVWCSKIGTKSFDLAYSVLKIENGIEIEVASAKTVLVCFDFTKSTSALVPEDWKMKML